MKKVWPALPVAFLVGGALYGLLAAVQPPPRKISEDPWLDAWKEAGLRVQARAFSTEPRRDLHLLDARPWIDETTFRGTTLRSYFVNGISSQVVELPKSDLLSEQIPEGRHFRIKLVENGGAAHLCRVGRRFLSMSIQVRVPFVAPMPAPQETVERAFEAFEEACRRQS